MPVGIKHGTLEAMAAARSTDVRRYEVMTKTLVTVRLPTYPTGGVPTGKSIDELVSERIAVSC